MINEFIESLKLKDIVFFVLFIVLFCMYFKKNKKVNRLTRKLEEKFSNRKTTLDTSDNSNNNLISQENLIAINNLGEIVKDISNTSGQLTLNNLVIKDGNKNVNVLDTLKAIQASITQNRTEHDELVKVVNGKQPKGSYQLTTNLNEDIKNYLLSKKFYFKSSKGPVLWSNHITGGTGSEKYLASRPGGRPDWFRFTSFN